MKLPIRVRLTAWYAAVLAAIIVGLGAFLVLQLRADLEQTVDRQLRAKAQTKSMLDELPGVGPARKRALLKVFGSTKQMRGATIDEIAAVPGISRALAERIRAGLDA